MRLLIASVDRAREMGINWWEHDPTLLVGRRDLAEENRQLRACLAALQSRHADSAYEPAGEDAHHG